MSMLGDNFLVNFIKLSKEYRRSACQVVAEYGFTPNEIDVLLYLSNNPSADTARDICNYRGISKSLVCRSIESLTRGGYLKTVQDGRDLRLLHLKPTERAAPLLASLARQRDEFTQLIFDGVSEDDRRALDRVVAAMKENLKKIT